MPIDPERVSLAKDTLQRYKLLVKESPEIAKVSDESINLMRDTAEKAQQEGADHQSLRHALIHQAERYLVDAGNELTTNEVNTSGKLPAESPERNKMSISYEHSMQYIYSFANLMTQSVALPGAHLRAPNSLLSDIFHHQKKALDVLFSQMEKEKRAASVRSENTPMLSRSEVKAEKIREMAGSLLKYGGADSYLPQEDQMFIKNTVVEELRRIAKIVESEEKAYGEKATNINVAQPPQQSAMALKALALKLDRRSSEIMIKYGSVFAASHDIAGTGQDKAPLLRIQVTHPQWFVSAGQYIGASEADSHRLGLLFAQAASKHRATALSIEGNRDALKAEKKAIPQDIVKLYGGFGDRYSD